MTQNVANGLMVGVVAAYNKDSKHLPIVPAQLLNGAWGTYGVAGGRLCFFVDECFGGGYFAIGVVYYFFYYQLLNGGN